MALQARREHDGTPQQARIRGPVREMTRFAPLHADGRMFESKRTARLRVAVHAGFLIGESLLDHPGPRGHAPRRIESSMRVVTV